MGLVRPFTSTSATAPYPRTTARCGHRDRRQGGPTATERELARRRGPRAHHEQGCKCQRHRGRARRQRWGRKPRRKKGDKNKNGRRATLVVMYTLRQGEDGRLHGPVNGQQEGVRDIRLAEVGVGMGPAAGAAPRLAPRNCQGGPDRRRRRDVPGAATAAAVPWRDPDLGRPARAGDALGGRPVTPSGRERGVDTLGRGVGRVALQRACAHVTATVGADNPSATAPRCKRGERPASRPWEAACGSNRPGHHSGENNEGSTNAAGRRRPGASHRLGAVAGGSVDVPGRNARVHHRSPDRT